MIQRVIDVSTVAANSTPEETTLPWWKYKILWLVIGGPLAVVVAATITAVIAIRGADEVLSTEETSKRSISVKGLPEGSTPAIEARNHAATAKP